MGLLYRNRDQVFNLSFTFEPFSTEETCIIVFGQIDPSVEEVHD